MKILNLVFFCIIFSSCTSKEETKTMSYENWIKGWIMIENSWEEKYEIAETQFDSLLNSKGPVKISGVPSALVPI